MDDLTPENFELLLSWLHPDREEAGREYERIRVLLIRKFAKHDTRSSPETLADRTMDRVSQTITPEFVANWEGKKERFFHRVAYYILLEDLAPDEIEVELPDNFNVPIPDKEDREPRLNCQDKCLQELPEDKRYLIVKYYGGDKATKIKNRKELARKLKVTLPVLRVKAHRIRRELRTCIDKCLAAAAVEA